MSTPTVLSLLSETLRLSPTRPLVTFYDGATDERVELSARTFDNWVKKIANLLTDELELEPGSTMSVSMPTHWQSTVAMIGAWAAGLAICFDGSPVVADAHVVGPDPRDAARLRQGAVIACSLRPLGAPFAHSIPDGWYDFGVAVPTQPDIVVSPVEVSSSDAALHVITGSITHEELITQAHETADELGLAPTARLITDANPARASGISAGLVAPIATGGSVVLVVNCDAKDRARIAKQENVTTSFWLTG